VHNGSKGSLSLGKRSSSSEEEEVRREERAKMCDISIWGYIEEGSMVLEGT